MARPPLPLGTWGTITTEKIRDGGYRALTRFRDTDGKTRRVTATGPSKAAAERALRDVLGTRTASAGELITAETQLNDLANLWITGLEAEGRIEQTTINEYCRVLDNLVLPSVGGLKLREATTGRLDRLLLRLRDQSVNRQRRAKVVLGAMLDLAVRHDAIPTNPARGTSRVHRPKQETKAPRVEDLVEIRAAVRRWVNADRPGPKASSDMADIIDLMLATGCRIGEIFALRWSKPGPRWRSTHPHGVGHDQDRGRRARIGNPLRSRTPADEPWCSPGSPPKCSACAGSSRTTPSLPPATAPGTRSSTSSGGGGRSARTPALSG